VFRRTVDAFAATLGDLSPAEWGRHALRDLDIQGLVGHLIGVERDFLVALDLRSADAGDQSAPSDHIAATQASATAQTERAPEDTRREWLLIASTTADHVATFDDERLRSPVTLHSLTLPVDAMLIVRSFEMWTHDEDIRRATGRLLAAPEAARLIHMTQLAVSLLPAGMMRAQLPLDRGVRLVLTGPGGGTWPAAVGSGPVDARLVVDAVSFCRVVANRVDPAHSGAVVTGDESLGAELLAGARTLALD
jgi:uncharacterized protein (TIGR03083 family)